MHLKQKDFKCDVEGCDYECVTSGKLLVHKRIHSTTRPFVCTWHGCNYSCKQSNGLRHHMRTHTGEKPYSCRFCGETFRASGTLKSHERTHTGERPFLCDVCGEAFARNDYLKHHMEREHNDAYVARRKQQEERVSRALLATGWTEWFHSELMPPARHFKREKKIDFTCVDADDTFCRIDFVLGYDSGYIFLEVDENQHKFGYDSLLSCDMKRMAKVMASITTECTVTRPRIFWLRYNPNSWHVEGVLQSISKNDREVWLTMFLNDMQLEEDLLVGYAYYDVSEGNLDVLENSEYHPHFADVAINLTKQELALRCLPCVNES